MIALNKFNKIRADPAITNKKSKYLRQKRILDMKFRLKGFRKYTANGFQIH